MDKDVEKILESWQLAEYIPIFAENKINIDTLGLLDADVIKELIRPVGDRVRFQKNLNQWNELTNPLAGRDNDNLVTKLRHPAPLEYENIFGLHQKLVADEQHQPACSTPSTPVKKKKSRQGTYSQYI